MPKITLTAKNLTIDGNRAGIRIDAGPWVDGVPADLIKIRCKRGCFPGNFRAAIAVTNNSDMRTDYFEADTIRLLPGHALYDQAKALSV
jgi:hypothetical protein